MKFHDEIRKAGKWLFVWFVSFCVAVNINVFLEFMGIDKYWYFPAGAVYCLISGVLWKATKSWRG
jgi:hypothetical protein